MIVSHQHKYIKLLQIEKAKKKYLVRYIKGLATTKPNTRVEVSAVFVLVQLVNTLVDCARNARAHNSFVILVVIIMIWYSRCFEVQGEIKSSIYIL